MGGGSSDGTLAPPLATPEAAFDLLSAVQELHAARELSAGLTRLAERLRPYFDFDNLSVLLLDEAGRELRFALGLGLPPEIAEHWRFGPGQGIVGAAFRDRRAVRVGDVGADPRYIRAVDGVCSELAVPLLAGERAIGVLDVGSSRAHHFTAEHEGLLTLLAGSLAGAIEVSQVHRNLRDQAQTLSLLHEASREINALLDQRQLLERVAVLLLRLIDYDLFSVLLWSPERQLLEPWLAYEREGGLRGSAICHALSLGVGLCGTAAALRQPIRVANVHLDPRWAQCVSGLEAKSELVVPLVHKDRLLGVLDLECARYDAFSARHEQLLSTLAPALSIALENARLYERLRADEQQIRDDLATAREIQAQLLPRASPWLPGLQVGFAYEPARDLGGDFYDFLAYGEGRLAVVVGDVAGKSTAAALYGSFAVGTLREVANQGSCSPAQVLADMNRKLGELAIGRRFVAMAFAVYDAGSRTLTVANSGLPHPFLLRPGGEVEEIPVHGVPLGLLADRSYEEQVLHLSPGSAVVFCSDGVEESRNLDEQELGSQAVRSALARLARASAAEIAQGLLQAARRHGGSAEASDDRTVVVLKVEG